ncbi:glycosyltransferase family 9 protein [bacterium]|nr:glycosyltransferase family 9 protein [bacterium]
MKNELEKYQNIDCRKFNGYKPCEPDKKCPCDDREPYGTRILIVNLDFIGDVLMTTALLPAIKRTYPESIIHWITRKNAMPVLENNPFIFCLWEWNSENRMILNEMEFDIVLNGDKNRDSSAFTVSLNSKVKRGFGLNKYGAVIPLNREALYNFRMGLDDELKFRKNRRTGLDILAETWKVDYQLDEYILELTDKEKEFTNTYRESLGISNELVIGFNTGCSNAFPLKKMTIEQHVQLIDNINQNMANIKILLLGGREDTDRNREIKSLSTFPVVETPTTEGLRRGILYENSCDVIVSGDTLGMHIGIGLKKYVVAWFGISCSEEIELYQRGEKIQSHLDCSPCWRKTCDNPRCIKELNIDKIYKSILKYYERFFSK